MAARNFGRKTGKRWPRYAVLAFCVVDGLGIYAAHEKLSRPVAVSMIDDPVAIGASPQQLSPQLKVSVPVSSANFASLNSVRIPLPEPVRVASPPQHQVAAAAQVSMPAPIAVPAHEAIAPKVVAGTRVIPAPVTAPARQQVLSAMVAAKRVVSLDSLTVTQSSRVASPVMHTTARDLRRADRPHHRSDFAAAFADGVGLNAMPEPAFGQMPVNAPIEAGLPLSSGGVASAGGDRASQVAQAGLELPALADTPVAAAAGTDASQ